MVLFNPLLGEKRVHAFPKGLKFELAYFESVVLHISPDAVEGKREDKEVKMSKD